MEGLKGCVQRSDTKSVPQFLDQSSDTRENEASRHFAISLYAELAQVHRQAIIPYIPRMMASIVRSLPFSADSQQLHEACARAVASVARYTIDPTKPYDSNQQILFNLCSPLLPVLASKLEPSAAGAAICLQALVESEKWKFAHPDLQGLICSKVTTALAEQGVHTVAFLYLVKSLTKFSRDASHQHVAEWVRIGFQILQADSDMPGSWQRRAVAAQLIAIILKTADVDKLGLDLRATTKILEAYLMDKATVVQIAVAEALEMVKGAAFEKGVHHELADSGAESKRRNSDTEESGLQDLSASISPRSDTSSHEAVPSMASSTLKFGMGPKSLNQRPRDSSCLLTSHASLSLSRSSKLKENTPATIPRRVLSEIPASGKLLSNSEVLPSSCPSKPLSRSSVDLGNKVGNQLMHDTGLLGSGKSIQCVHNRVHDCALKTSSSVRKHVEGCQNFSNRGCTSTLDKEEDGSNNILATTDHLSGMADFEILEEHNDRVEEGMPRLPRNSLCRMECTNDDCTAGVLSGGCTGDALSRTHASKGASFAEEMGSLLKVEKPHVCREDFTFRAPGSLLPSLQSSSSTTRIGKSCKKCSGLESHLAKEASWMGSESEESQVVAMDSESRDETSGASSCTPEDANSSGDRFSKLGSFIHKQSAQKINDLDGKHLSVELNDCEIHASGRDWLSTRDTSDSGFGEDENIEKRQSGNLHRSFKKSGRRRHFSSQTEGYPKLSARTDCKIRGTDNSDKEPAVLSEVSQKQNHAGILLGLVCAVGILVLAVMVIQHVNQIYDSHALVPT